MARSCRRAGGALGLAVLAAGLAVPSAARAAPATADLARLAPARLAPAGLVLGRWPGRAGTAAAGRYYGYPYPHPPACTDGGACVADTWEFYRGQCTSWVAYRLNERSRIRFGNSYGGRGRWGNALHWGPQARKLGIRVNSTPAAGAVAWYSATRAAPDGHVAYVEKVLSPTSIVMSEMNYDADNGFWVHVITRATGDWPTDFIHFRAARR
jgi:surface antigen